MGSPRSHICFVAPNAYPVLARDPGVRLIGGAEVQQMLVARGLAGRGYRVSMICLDFGQPERTTIDGVEVLRAYRPEEGILGLRFVWPRITAIGRCMRQADAEIYYQRVGGSLTCVVAWYCRRMRRKSVFAAAGEPMIRHRREKLLYEYGVRAADYIVVQSLLQGRQIRKHFSRDSILVPSIVEDVMPGGAQVRGTVLWISTIRSIKRPGLFLDLAAALPDHRFVMIGGAAPEEWTLYGEIRRRALSIRNLEFAGFVPYESIPDYMARAAILVNTSASEGFPNAFLQAWQQGVPTVSLLVGDHHPWNEHRLGQSVASLEEMRAVVEALMRDQPQREIEGAKCRDYVERFHSPATVLDHYERLIESARRA